MNATKIKSALSRHAWKVAAVFLLLVLITPLFTVVIGAAGIVEEWKGAVNLDYSLDYISTKSMLSFLLTPIDPFSIAHGITSLLWGLNRTLADFIISLTREAFSLDFIATFSSAISKYVQALAGIDAAGIRKNGLFYGFLGFVLLILAAYVAYQGLAKHAFSQALSAIANAVVVFLVAIVFIAYSPTLLNDMSSFSAEVNDMVLSVGMTALKDGASKGSKTGAVDYLEDSMWQTTVKNPWLILQFGDMQVDDFRANRLLELPSGSENRFNVVVVEVEEYGNDNLTEKAAYSRLGIAFVILLANCIIYYFVLMFILTSIMYEILFLMYVVSSPFVLAFSMLPIGNNGLGQYALKLFNALMGKTIILFLMTVAFSFSSIAYTLFADKSFLTIAIIQIVIFGSVYTSVPAILSLIGLDTPTTMQGAKAAGRAVGRTARGITRVPMRMAGSFVRYKAMQTIFGKGYRQRPNGSGNNGAPPANNTNTGVVPSGGDTITSNPKQHTHQYEKSRNSVHLKNAELRTERQGRDTQPPRQPKPGNSTRQRNEGFKTSGRANGNEVSYSHYQASGNAVPLKAAESRNRQQAQGKQPPAARRQSRSIASTILVDGQIHRKDVSNDRPPPRPARRNSRRTPSNGNHP